MKTIIAGSRSFAQLPREEQSRLIEEAVEGLAITEVVSGTARGADRAGEDYARKMGIPLKLFPASWNKHGRAAGYFRNVDMANYADALVAMWDGQSRGTKHMIEAAQGKGLETRIIYFTKQTQPNTEIIMKTIEGDLLEAKP